MSPEQARGKPVDKRADIWAFGCVLYEMLTGARAFPGDDVSETLAAVIKGEPDWGALPRETPEAIRRLFRRCLTKDSKGRIADASVGRIEIEEAQSGRPPLENQVVSGGSRRRETLAWTVAAVALAAVAGLGIPAARHFREVAVKAPEMRLEIYGLEERHRTQALVLELVEGPTLADRIAQGPIPLDEVLSIAKQIAEALEADVAFHVVT